MARPVKKTRKPRTSQPKVTVEGKRQMDKEKHDALVTQLMEIIKPGVTAHQTKANQYCGILIALAAVPVDDNVAKAKNAAYINGESTVIGDTRYPKALGHLNSIAISVMQVLFPARQMYGSVELNAKKQQETAAIVAAMNTHAKQYRHYTAMARVIMDSLALNVGIVSNSWETQKAKFGAKAVSSTNVTRESSIKTVHEGTKLRHCDPLNTILQPGVNAEDYQFDAQYYAIIEQVNYFDLLRKSEAGEISFGKDHKGLLRSMAQATPREDARVKSNSKIPFYNHLGSDFGMGGGSGLGAGKLGLYRNRPNMHRPILANAENRPDIKAAKCFDYAKFANDGDVINYEEDRPDCCNELMTLVVRGLPEDFGQQADAEDSAMKLFEFKILNGSTIVGIKEIGTAHGMMNISITRPLSELGRNVSLSMSEKLLPFQEAASSLMNTFVRQARGSANNGMTYYIEEVMNKNSVLDPSTGMVPLSLEEMKKLGIKDIRAAVQSVGGRSPDTSVLTGIDQLGARMQDVVPTDAISQMAGLNRPVQHQSRRLAELQNLHVYALARTIHEELMTPTTHMHTQDTLAFQKEINIVGPSGAVRKIDPSVFANVDLDVAVSDGMRGLDTLSISDRLEKILQYAFQSRRVQNDIDVVALTNYLLQMDGANVDMDMFRYENEFDKLSPEAKEQAFQMLQQAAAEQGGDETQQ